MFPPIGRLSYILVKSGQKIELTKIVDLILRLPRSDYNLGAISITPTYGYAYTTKDIEIALKR